MKTDLVAFLEAIGACSDWREDAQGKTARELFEAAKTRPGGSLSWLAMRLDLSSRRECYCVDCGQNAFLGLPFSAWVEAAEAFLLARK